MQGKFITFEGCDGCGKSSTESELHSFRNDEVPCECGYVCEHTFVYSYIFSSGDDHEHIRISKCDKCHSQFQTEQEHEFVLIDTEDNGWGTIRKTYECSLCKHRLLKEENSWW